MSTLIDALKGLQSEMREPAYAEEDATERWDIKLSQIIAEHERSGGWIFSVNRPFYPSVDFFATEEEASRALDEWIKENGEGSVHKVVAYVAHVSKLRIYKTDY